MKDSITQFLITTMRILIIIFLFIFMICPFLVSIWGVISYSFEDPILVLQSLFVTALWIGIPLLIVFILISSIKSPDYIFENKKIPTYNNISYYRTIPLNGNLFKSYALLLRFDIIKRGQNIISAILLDWHRKGFINFININKTFINLHRSTFAIQFNDDIHFDTEIEHSLLELLLSASGENRILEESEFFKFCRDNSAKIDCWFWDLRLYGEELLINDGLYIKQNNKNKSKTIVTQQATEKVIELIGFEKFLLEYSMIQDKETIDVTLWEDYLIFAQLLGIADKVNKQVKNLNLNFGSYSDINFDFFNILNHIKE